MTDLNMWDQAEQHRMTTFLHECRAPCRAEERIHVQVTWAKHPLEWMQDTLPRIYRDKGEVIRVERVAKCPPYSVIRVMERLHHLIRVPADTAPEGEEPYMFWMILYPHIHIIEPPDQCVSGPVMYRSQWMGDGQWRSEAMSPTMRMEQVNWRFRTDLGNG